MQIYVFLGAPGAGKGTAAARIANDADIHHVSTGAMLRDAVKNGTPAGLSAKKYMDKGTLVPDQVLVDMLGELLSTSKKDATIILDGFPRNENQALQLDELAAKHGATVKAAIDIEAPNELLISRLGGRRVCPSCGMGYHVTNMPPKREGVCDKCGTALITRNDDKPETIKKRLEVYAEQTAPLIGLYKKAGKLRTVNGADEADKVAKKIAAIIKG